MKLNWGKHGFLTLGVIVTCALLVEGTAHFAVRHIVKNPAAHVPDSESGLQLFTPGLGSLPMDVRTHFKQRLRTSEFDTTIQTNNVGFREANDYLGEPVDLAFMGDSFAFGYGVEEEERFANLVPRNFPPGTRTHCYSWPNGNFPATFYIYLKEHPELVPKTLVMSLFLGNDLDRDPQGQEIEYDAAGRATRARLRAVEPPGLRKLGLVGTAWEPMYRRLSQSSTFRWAYILSTTLRRTGVPFSDENPQTDIWPPHFGKLGEMAVQSLTQVRNLRDDLLPKSTRLLIVLIPDQIFLWNHPRCPYNKQTCEKLVEDDHLAKAVTATLTDWGIDVLDPSTLFRDKNSSTTPLYFALDGHLTAAGHTLLAHAISERLRLSSLHASLPSR